MSVIFLSLLHRQKNWLALGLSRLLVVPKNLCSMDLLASISVKSTRSGQTCLKKPLMSTIQWFTLVLVYLLFSLDLLLFTLGLPKKMLVQISFTWHCSLTSQHDQNKVVTSRKSITKYWKVKKVATIKNMICWCKPSIQVNCQQHESYIFSANMSLSVSQVYVSSPIYRTHSFINWTLPKFWSMRETLNVLANASIYL